jgi:hypothetical protein
MFLVREGRGAGLAVALWYAVGNAAYLAWRKAYYGFWLPNTFYAKVGATYAQVLRGWDYVLWFFAGLGVLVLMMVLAGVAFSRHREGLARPMTFAVVYLLLILGVGGDYNEYPRFFIPILPVIYVVCAVGLDGILGGVRRKTGATVAFSIGLLIAVAAAGESLHASHPIREYARGRLRRMEFMRSVGTWAAENTSKDASIACKYIGVVGYYSGRTILDMHGLTNLHIGHKKMESFGSGMAGHEKTDVDYVLAQSPDYLFVNLKQRAGGGEDADLFMDTEKILALYEQKEARTGDIRFYYYARR